MRTLLMGGQACVFYGAAEFSRHLDLLIVADPANLDGCSRLARGHAVHFRCAHPDVAGLRIDVMAVLRVDRLLVA